LQRSRSSEDPRFAIDSALIGQALPGDAAGGIAAIHADPPAAQPIGHGRRGAGAAEQVGHELPWVAGGGDDAGHQVLVLLGVVAPFLLREAHELDGVHAIERRTVPGVFDRIPGAARTLAVAPPVLGWIGDVLFVEDLRRPVANVVVDGVVVADPVVGSRFETGDPTDAPDDLALEVAAAKDGIEQHLDVVAGRGVEMHVKRSAASQQVVHEHQSGCQHGEVVGQRSPGVAKGRLSAGVARFAGVVTGLAGKGGIGVDQVDAAAPRGSAVGPAEQSGHGWKVVALDQRVGLEVDAGPRRRTLES